VPGRRGAQPVPLTLQGGRRPRHYRRSQDKFPATNNAGPGNKADQEVLTMIDYPAMITPVNHVEPVPRRVRAMLAGETVLDTIRAVYVWEWAYYPQYYIPTADVRLELLVPEGLRQHSPRGEVELHTLQLGDTIRPHAARILQASEVDGLSQTARFEWDSVDAWYEEDDRVFVHPRSPYVRVDALRSTRRVRIELDGLTLAESSSPVMVFETGLPTRYYLNRTDVDFSLLIATETVTACPYKGTTSGYWSVRTADEMHADLAWSYDFPSRELLPIAGLVAFYNERVDTFLDAKLLPRPTTHFSRRGPASDAQGGSVS
jgi:uncharacterized protein (DUF427 family)